MTAGCKERGAGKPRPEDVVSEFDLEPVVTELGRGEDRSRYIEPHRVERADERVQVYEHQASHLGDRAISATGVTWLCPVKFARSVRSSAK